MEESGNTNPVDTMLVVTIQRQAFPRLGGTAELAVLVLVGPVSVAVKDFITLVLSLTFSYP
jgi:hypothetical protein